MPNIFNVWADEGWEEPVIEERFEPDRTILSLSFISKSDEKKATKKSDEKKATVKTQKQYEMILDYMKFDKWYKTSEISVLLDVKETRTKELLKALIAMGKLTDDGATKGKKYKKVKE